MLFMSENTTSSKNLTPTFHLKVVSEGLCHKVLQPKGTRQHLYSQISYAEIAVTIDKKN